MKFRLVEEQRYGKKSKKQLPTFSHADLLTVEEAEKVPTRLRKYNNFWWLQSPGHSASCAVRVDFDGSVFKYGLPVKQVKCVRPAIHIINLNDYKINDLFKFGGKWFEIVDESLAFCVSDIGSSVFDTKSNNYEKSKIKQYVDNWFNKNNK